MLDHGRSCQGCLDFALMCEVHGGRPFGHLGFPLTVRSIVVLTNAVQREHWRAANNVRDMRAVRELRSLAYDLNGFRLTENAYGKFHRLRKVGIDVVTKSGRNGLRRNEGLKSLGNR
jgi:hypothetical protein